MEEVHLSVVAGSRNDNHGGDLLYRMQHFVTGFIEQCKKHCLKAELILVDWNSPEEKPPLAKALKFPKDKGPCIVRIIKVPKEVHETLAHAKELPMFQMIAKNVGIRRAKGRYVLATNIDVLFSDELVRFLRDELKSGTLYRTDRLDVPSVLPKSGDILDFCKKNYFRINSRFGTKILENGEWMFVDTSASRNSRKFSQLKKHFWTFWLRKLLLILSMGNEKFDLGHLIRRIKFFFTMNIHTNACGDFTLLSAQDWKALRGYPELEGYSWHLDAFLLYQAVVRGIKKKELPPEKCIYHIEHEKGSGYIPEHHDLVFERIKKKRIPYVNDRKLLTMVAHMVKEQRRSGNYTYNGEDWGFAKYEFEEVLT